MKQYTQKEFIRKVGFSKSTVINYTKELEKQGYTFEMNKGHRRYTIDEVKLFIRIYNYLDEQNGSVSLEQVVRSLYPKPEEKYLPPATEIIQTSYLEVACDLTDSDDYVPPEEPPYLAPIMQEQLLIDYEFVGEVQRAIKVVEGRMSDIEEENRRLHNKVDRMATARAKQSLQVSKNAKELYFLKQDMKKAREEIASAQSYPAFLRFLKKIIDLFRKKKPSTY